MVSLQTPGIALPGGIGLACDGLMRNIPLFLLVTVTRVFLPMLGVLVGVLLPFIGGSSGKQLPEHILYGGVGFCGGAVVFLILQRTWFRRVVVRRGVRCIRCDYPLRHLRNAAACPECGERRTRKETANAWRWLVEMRRG